MLIGRIRPIETRTIDVEGATLADVQAAVAAQTPTGWDVTDVPVAMPAGSAKLTATATIARRDDATELEADDMAALEAKVPEGWQLLGVRSI